MVGESRRPLLSSKRCTFQFLPSTDSVAKLVVPSLVSAGAAFPQAFAVAVELVVGGRHRRRAAAVQGHRAERDRRQSADVAGPDPVSRACHHQSRSVRKVVL